MQKIKTGNCGYICSESHFNFFTQIKVRKVGIIEEKIKEEYLIGLCLANLTKSFIPIIEENRVICYVGICGCLMEGSEDYAYKKLQKINF